MNKQQEDRVVRAKVQIQSKNPFFSYMSLYLKPIEDEKTETAGVDCKGNMYYNPEFIESLSDLELQGVLCFPKGTLINGQEMKPIEEIQRGDLVINKFGELEEVKKTFQREVDEDLINIKPSYVLPILATKEHPFYVKKYKLPINCKKENRNLKNQFEKVKPIWVKARELKDGDLIAIPKAKQQNYTTKINLSNYPIQKQKYTHLINNIPLNKDVAFLMGLFVSDGSTSKGGLRFSLNNYTKKPIIDKVKDIMRNNFKMDKYQIITQKGSRGEDISFNSRLLSRFFRENFGKDCKNKKIPPFILYNNKEILKSFLDGYISGDGCKCNKRIQYSTTSKVLSYQLQIAYARLGILTNNYLYERKGIYHKLKGIDLKDLKNYQGYFQIEKSKNKHYLEDDNYFWVKIKISKEKYKGKVYNFETKKTHTYCAGNIVSHNCHEISHLVFLHLIRQGTRDKEIFNISADFCINYIVTHNGYTLPKGCLICENDGSYNQNGIKLKDIDKKTAEEIYDDIYKQIPKISAKNKSNLEDGQFDKHIYSEEMSEEEKRAIVKEWNEKIHNAMSIAQQRGEMPIGMERLLENLHKEKINWRSILNQFVTKEIKYSYDYSKPHKRSQSIGVYMPHSVREMIEIAICVDLSGSIEEKEYADFMSEVIGIARVYQSRVTFKFYSHDTEGYYNGLVKNGNIEQIKKIKMKGGGGTSHLSVMELMNKDKLKLVIFFTDGYSDLDSINFEKYNYKKLFVISKNGTDEQLKNKNCRVVKIE